jgi:hypothetical protein
LCLPDARGLTKIHAVKTTLRVLAALGLVAFLWLGYRFVLFRRGEADPCATLTLTGDINSDTFLEARDCLVRATAAKKTFVVKTSGGGDAFAALALGILIHRHHWNVEVVDLCASSCANWIFPAGKTKYLNGHSLLLFHGGPHQVSLLEMANKVEREMAVNGAPGDPVVLGHVDKEAVAHWNPGTTAAEHEVLEFLSMDSVTNPVEKLRRFAAASDAFYQELGINPALPSYGQTGGYEPLYKSYKYGGFIYRLDSMRRLGIDNIELKEGEWHPERHPDYGDVYEVTYP